MSVTLTKEETENLILVALNDLQQDSNYPENGVALKKLAANVNMEPNDIKKFLIELKQKNVVSWLEQTINGEIYIKTTEQTIEYFEKRNTLPLSETASQLLKKSYDIFKRAGYDSTFQFNSTFIGGIIGITNIQKIRSAIEMLNDKGLINNPAIMSDNIIYFISAKGVDMIENEPKKQETNGTFFINAPGGNVAVNSSDFKQNINNNELSGYLAILEKLINENLKEDEKTNALTNLETIKELTKVEPPNKPLIQMILNNLDKIPILFDIVNRIRECFN